MINLLMSWQERERLIDAIAVTIREYEKESYRAWARGSRQFLLTLEAMRPDLLVAFHDVLTTRYLEPPMVQRIVSGDDYQTIQTLHAHLDWLHKRPLEAQHLLNRAWDLSKSPVIERRDNGWYPTLETHLRAESEYHRHSGYKDHTDVSYIENRVVKSLVELHVDHADEFIQYMNDREWRGYDAQNFQDYLEQKALKQGWL